MRPTRFMSAVIALAALVAVGTPGQAAPAPYQQVESAYAQLNRLDIAGTAWWTDPTSHTVTIAADASVTSHDLAQLTALARRTHATLIREPGTVGRRIAGADLFYGVQGRCTIAFNVRNAVAYYFLTSAHCVGAVGTTVWADSAHTIELGVVAGVNPTYDFALVRYTNAKISKPSSVNLHNGFYQRITSVSSGYVGQYVTRSGAVSGVHTGTITGLNATVNYPDGTVYGLIRTSVCAEPGDSGGPLFATSTAIGITSGGSGNCTIGGTTYFASAQRAMSTYGVTVY